MPLTAVRISSVIVVDTDGAVIELALRRGIWNASRDLCPQRLTCGVIVEQRSRFPYLWEVRNEPGHRCIVIWCAFGGRICHSVVWDESRGKDGHNEMIQTSDLCLRLLGATVLSEGGCCKGREGSDDPTLAQNEHGKDSGEMLCESGVLFECWWRGERGENSCQQGDGVSLGSGIYIAKRDVSREMKGSEDEGMVQIIRSRLTEAVVPTSRERHELE